MKSRWMMCTIAILLGFAAPVGAQDCAEVLPEGGEERIGCVNNLMERRLFFFKKTVDASEAAEIHRQRAGGIDVVRPVPTEALLNDRDVVRLGSRVDMEMYLHGLSESRVVLERGGVWSLQRDSLPRLVMTHGQMVVEQFEGRLEAYLEGVLNVIHATTVYYDVDSTAEASYVYLKEGHISFPDHGIDVQGEQMTWILRDGVAPEPIALESVGRWRAHEELSRMETWEAAARPIVQRPRFWLLTAGIVAGATLLDCAVTNVVCGGGDTAGAYRIPIPE